MILMGAEFRTRWVSLILPASLIFSSCTHPLVRRLEEFQSAKKSGNFTKAAEYLAPEARVWFENKEGPGKPLRAQGGPWAEWDRFFHAVTTKSPPTVKQNAVQFTFAETNDFFRLIDRAPRRAKAAWWFDGQGRIQGVLYQRIPATESRDRLDEFLSWLDKKDPGQRAFLMPDGEIVPDLERARRWRERLIEWRTDAGLPSVPLEGA